MKPFLASDHVHEFFGTSFLIYALKSHYVNSKADHPSLQTEIFYRKLYYFPRTP